MQGVRNVSMQTVQSSCMVMVETDKIEGARAVYISPVLSSVSKISHDPPSQASRQADYVFPTQMFLFSWNQYLADIFRWC